MNRLFIDTDVALDLLTGRQPHYGYAAQLFSLADKKKIKLCISALSFNNLSYILGRELQAKEARKVLIDFKTIVQVLPVNDKIIHLALNSDFTDFEDAVQHYTAIEENLSLILTRNIRDYRKSLIQVSTPEEYLKTN